MKTAQVIIGGGFGDEGKGLFTDYLATHTDKNACNVRFNGGAQAGHTVETPDGKRHVFSHFGSGSFAGLPTYLSRFFVCNPIVFLREQVQLKAFGVAPKLYADENCPVTTPYDMMMNQVVEEARGRGRHGSVGIGFGETLERHEHAQYALRLGELGDLDNLRQRLDTIRNEWVPLRLARLEVKDLSEEWKARFASEGIRERYIEDVGAFLTGISPVPASYLKRWDHYIFEGAQGLLLDQDRGWFPHVTRSNTGLHNVLELARPLRLKKLEVYYLTRCYKTRHGAGPLPHEIARLPYPDIVDMTNKPHPYQGSLRFAWFDLDLFRDTVMRDMQDGAHQFEITPHLGMSCLDQIRSEAIYYKGGVPRRASREELLNIACESIGAADGLASYGPTRATVQEFKLQPDLYGRHGATDIGDGFLEPFDILQDNVAAAQA